MSGNQIEEGNKLIAEFMGYVYNADDTLNGIPGILRHPDKSSVHLDITKPFHAQYHSSWDWLMPVCQKINSKESQLTCESNGVKDSIICYINAMRGMKRGVLHLDINETWSGVIQFIQWYNQNTK